MKASLTVCWKVCLDGVLFLLVSLESVVFSDLVELLMSFSVGKDSLGTVGVGRFIFLAPFFWLSTEGDF